jgi:hypothetical protein
LSKEKPNSYQTGRLDVKVSDKIFFADKYGHLYIGRYYQFAMGGSEVCRFYDQNGFDIANITHWAEMPSLP